MGFLSWLRGARSKNAENLPLVQLPSDDSFALQVVGESFHQDAFEVVTGGRQKDGVQQTVTVHLVLDDANPYDRNAVKVLVGGVLQVGHLSRPDAIAYRRWLRTRGHGSVIGVCNGMIRGGWDRGNDDAGSFGIFLDFPLYG